MTRLPNSLKKCTKRTIVSTHALEIHRLKKFPIVRLKKGIITYKTTNMIS
jgi:hypothetical protein